MPKADITGRIITKTAYSIALERREGLTLDQLIAARYTVSLSRLLLFSPQRPSVQSIMQQIYTFFEYTSRRSSGWKTLPGSNRYLDPTATWIQPLPGSNRYLDPTATWIQPLPGSNRYLDPTATWIQPLPGSNYPTATWIQPTMISICLDSRSMLLPIPMYRITVKQTLHLQVFQGTPGL